MRKQLKQHIRAISFLALVAIVGAIFITPVGAHVGNSVRHLWGAPGHIKSKVQNHGDARYMRFGGTSFLPRGKTMTGAIAQRHEATDTLILTAVSFPVPINFAPNVVLVDMGDPTPPTGCPGSAANPRANPGFACIYTGWTNDADGGWDGAWDPATGGACGCRNGITLYNSNSGGGGSQEESAVWAVTAPTSSSASGSGTSPGSTYRPSRLTGKGLK